MRCIIIATIVAAACTSLAVAQFEISATSEKLELSLERPPDSAQIKAARPEYFDGCGVLRLGPQTCILIHTDDGRAYAVENTGNFWPGEYVHVSGLIDEDALACWPASIPAIYDNTIGACFAGYGTLRRGPQGCLVQFVADEGGTYVLDDNGDFWWGDRVYVTGAINEESMPCWPYDTPAIENNTIQGLFEGYGTLQRGPQGCFMQFVAEEGGTYVLDDYGDFWWGDRVYVTGAINEESMPCWPYDTPAIEDNTIQGCFSGFGVLDRGPQNCIVRFIADEGGAYVLDDYGDFWWGDCVYVSGAINENSWACWPAVTPEIEHNVIEACPE